MTTARNPIMLPRLQYAVLSVVAACAPVAAEPVPAAPPVVVGSSRATATAAGDRTTPAAADASARAPAPKMLSSREEPDVGPPDSATELPAGTTVLHIGDSFAGALGIELNHELKETGVRGILKYETATYIPTWASSKDLPGYLDRFKPDLVLITLGANELEVPDPAIRAPTIHRLVSRLGGRSCVWVAPPLWKGARPALLDVIRESCAPCLYLDSSALVPDLHRMRDHIHPTMEARKIWAKAVVGWLRDHRNPNGEHPWDLNP